MDRDELALKLDVSFGTIAAYEQGIREPSIENMIKLSKMFDCTVDYLIGNDRKEVPIIETKLSIDEMVLKFTKDLKEQLKEEIRREIRNEVKFQLECENLSEIASEIKKEIHK